MGLSISVPGIADPSAVPMFKCKVSLFAILRGDFLLLLESLSGEFFFFFLFQCFISKAAPWSLEVQPERLRSMYEGGERVKPHGLHGALSGGASIYQEELQSILPKFLKSAFKSSADHAC